MPCPPSLPRRRPGPSRHRPEAGPRPALGKHIFLVKTDNRTRQRPISAFVTHPFVHAAWGGSPFRPLLLRSVLLRKGLGSCLGRSTYLECRPVRRRSGPDRLKAEPARDGGKGTAAVGTPHQPPPAEAALRADNVALHGVFPQRPRLRVAAVRLGKLQPVSFGAFPRTARGRVRFQRKSVHRVDRRRIEQDNQQRCEHRTDPSSR